MLPALIREHKMRTTLTIDDEIARRLKEIAYRTGKSFKSVVNDSLRAGISGSADVPAPKPYRMKPVSLGEVVGPYDIDKALLLADRIEDEEIARKLQMRK